MCGLAGILSFDGVPIDARQLAAMGASLAHRGPDAEGTHRDAQAAPSIGLIQRRLAVIDLSAAANQPLANEDQTIWALLNGEIYNFAELRERLAARHTLKTSGDTEVLVHLYEEEAETGLAQLDGMFALAIWDARRRRLLLARDPFGKKPLYYTTDGRRFLFASEIKALLAAEVPARLAVARVPEYLAYGYVPTPHTLFAGIYKLPPASFLTVDASGVSAAREYYALAVPAQGEESKDSFEQATERVRDLLTRAVQKRLIADVPLGILLSGGVDSSGLAALAARHLPGRLKTFTVGFEGDAFYDERAPAAAVARALGSEHHESVVRPQAGALIETLLHHHDEPFGDSSALPMYLVAQEARRHVTVVIGGDGGDETFAGYDRFRAAQLAEKMPLVLRRLFAGLRVLPEGSLHHGFLRRLRRFVDAAAQPLDRRMQAWTGFFTVDEVSARLGIQADPDALLTSYREALGRSPLADTLSQVLYLNLRTYLQDDLLPKADRMTMAHGLEARSPLLDRALVEYVFTLPAEYKIQNGRGKRILRRVFGGLVPDKILARPKHGFGVPLGAWFRRDLRGRIEEALLGAPALGRLLDASRVATLCREHLEGRVDRGQQLWQLLMLELWLRKYRLA